MIDRVLPSALAVLLCASVSVAQENASSGEYVAKDLPCDIVFVKRVLTGPYTSVLYNTRFQPGGNLFVLRRDGALHNLTRLQAGDVSDPDVSYDAQRIVFSMMMDKTDWWHVYEIRADGAGLRQLTSGDHDNVDPCYLPNGQICFCSDRTGILNEYEMQRAELLYVMDADGSNVRQISFNLSEDFNPVVLQDGRVLWCRYEHHGSRDDFPLFVTRPDGRDTEEFFGSKGAIQEPIKVFFEATQLPDGRVISTALRHFYTWEAGALVVIDPRRGPTDGVSPLNVTPGTPTGWEASADGRYKTPCAMGDGSLLASWASGPVSTMWGPDLARVRDPEERARLMAKKKPDFGIWRLVWDASGTRLLRDRMLYNDPAFADLDPMPLVPRARPPVIPSDYQAGKQSGEFLCVDVYDNTLADRALSPGKGGWNVRKRILDWDNKPIQRGDIKAVRVVEGLPVMAQGNTYRRISHYHHEPKRILGTAPVYPDGSFRMQVPTEMPMHFQTLDAEGRVLTTQLSFVYLSPGENKLCIGCHEGRGQAPSHVGPMAMAAKHPPTVIDTPVDQREMFHFVRDIYPIFERNCVECHSGPTPAGEVDLSDDVSPTYNVCYETLRPWVRPGTIRASELMRMLTGKRDKGNCRLPALTDEEFDRLAKWIELGVLFRYHGDGQVWTPFTVQDEAQRVDPILRRRGCMSAACHGEGNYGGAQWIANFSRVFSDSGGGPIVPIEIAVNITHPDRSRLLVAPRDKRPDGLTRPERETALGLFEQNCTSCHGGNRAYWSAFDTTEQWQECIEKMCKKPKSTMSPPQIRLVAAWLAEFAGRQERPTCPNIWTDPDDPDYRAILAFVEEASEKFIGFRNPDQAANARCTHCHGAERWRSQASRAKSPAQWKQTIMRMVQKQWWGYIPQWGIRPPEAAIIHRHMLEQAGKTPPLPAVTESDMAADLLEKARRLRFQGKIDEAEILCRQALALQPQGTVERRVRLELGVLFTQYGIPTLTDEMRASRPPRELQY